MASNVDMIKVLQKFIFDTKRGGITWNRIPESSPFWGDILDAHTLRGEGFYARIKGELVVATLRVRAAVYDEGDQLRWFNSYVTIIFTAEEQIVRRIDGPDVVNQCLFDEARASLFPKELNALEEYLKDKPS